MKIAKLGILGLCLGLSSISFAKADFTAADELFKQRNEGADDDARLKNANKSYDAYEAIYKKSNLSDDEKLYAFTQMGRSALFGGGMLESAKTGARQDILDRCIDLTEKAVKHSTKQEHHYFRVACLAGRAKISNKLKKIPLASALKDAQGPALKSTEVNGVHVGGFEGGGILRVFAGVYVNRKAKVFDLYHPVEGLKFANLALATEERTYPPFPEPMSGEVYFENYYYQAQGQVAVAMENNKKADFQAAGTYLLDVVKKIAQKESDGTLPLDREPEAIAYKDFMQAYAADINECAKQADWVTCMKNKLAD